MNSINDMLHALKSNLLNQQGVININLAGISLDMQDIKEDLKNDK